MFEKKKNVWDLSHLSDFEVGHTTKGLRTTGPKTDLQGPAHPWMIALPSVHRLPLQCIYLCLIITTTLTPFFIVVWIGEHKELTSVYRQANKQIRLQRDTLIFAKMTIT